MRIQIDIKVCSPKHCVYEAGNGERFGSHLIFPWLKMLLLGLVFFKIILNTESVPVANGNIFNPGISGPVVVEWTCTEIIPNILPFLHKSTSHHHETRALCATIHSSLKSTWQHRKTGFKQRTGLWTEDQHHYQSVAILLSDMSWSHLCIDSCVRTQ